MVIGMVGDGITSTVHHLDLIMEKGFPCSGLRLRFFRR